jgi:flagellar export protein FliJ
MAFRFGLQSILHLRQSLEHQQELRLRAANQQVARVRHLIEQMDAHRSEMGERQDRLLQAGLTAAELRFELQCEAELLRHRRELELQQAGLEHVRDEQRELLRKARQQREILEALRDHQQRTYTQEAARREQRNLDDAFLLRRSYGKAEEGS